MSEAKNQTVRARVIIPQSLCHLASGQTEFDLKCGTVDECLGCLAKQFPKVATELFDSPGKLRSYINVSVNHEVLETAEMGKALNDGDEVQIMFMLGGG